MVGFVILLFVLAALYLGYLIDDLRYRVKSLESKMNDIHPDIN